MPPSSRGPGPLWTVDPPGHSGAGVSCLPEGLTQRPPPRLQPDGMQTVSETAKAASGHAAFILGSLACQPMGGGSAAKPPRGSQGKRLGVACPRWPL